jgi:DNA-binding response OmpR family regulator
MQALLARLGLVVTVTADPVRARDLLINKFFAVALVDVDTPSTGGGFDLLKFAREKSPLTTVIMMTARKAFDIGVAGFRGGAADVVVKEPDTVPYLKDRVVAAAEELMAISDRNTLLEDVSELHEEFLRRMRDLSRQRLDLEDRLLGRETTETGGPSDLCTVLVVNDDPKAAAQLQAVLPENKGWRFSIAQTGGAALDLANQVHPQIVLVRDPLPDLPARMVVNTLKAATPDAVAILYQPPVRRGSPGEVKMIEGSRVMVLVSGYTGPEQLVAPLDEIREGIRQKLKERRYLQAFRQSNLEFLQRYNTARVKIQDAVARGKK